ncbi:hypothetical protein DPMN_172044 [Dreissena polymorpha]|uniref:Transmembrane protein n=1 Tax=Dreissena polymorpha TaxID=45954 RepID=A0A9D4ICZ3_DREPO|nr:hypothetical protein DPMN_172044 [Dreissena polymorpha]
MMGAEITILVTIVVLIIMTTEVIEIVLTMLALRGQLDVVETMVDNAVRAKGEEVKPEVPVTNNVDVGNKVDRPKLVFGTLMVGVLYKIVIIFMLGNNVLFISILIF